MITWDRKKNEWLKKNRGISFENIRDIIEEEHYCEIIGSPTYQDQKFFIMEINNYIHVVPFEEDAERNVILKTAYPSRKYDRKYRKAKDYEDQA